MGNGGVGGQRSGMPDLLPVRSGHERGVRPLSLWTSHYTPAVSDLPVYDYAIEFRTLAASAGWGERELHGAYYNVCLSERLLDELSTCHLPVSLEGLIDLTLHIDTRLADRRTSRRLRDPESLRKGSRTYGQAPSRAVEVPETEPMQVGRTKLSMAERQCRRDNHLCLYCGGAGHLLSACPLKDNARQ